MRLFDDMNWISWSNAVLNILINMLYGMELNSLLTYLLITNIVYYLRCASYKQLYNVSNIIRIIEMQWNAFILT